MRTLGCSNVIMATDRLPTLGMIVLVACGARADESVIFSRPAPNGARHDPQLPVMDANAGTTGSSPSSTLSNADRCPDYWTFHAGLNAERIIDATLGERAPTLIGGCESCFSECTRLPAPACEAQDYCIERHCTCLECEDDLAEPDFCQCAASCLGPQDAPCLEPWVAYAKCVERACEGSCP